VALVVLSKVEQRLDAVRAVLGGAQVIEVAASVGVSRQTLHEWLTRYLLEGVAGLADRSHRPRSCPHATSETVRVRLVEMRRQHPRWGAKRIRMELLKKPLEGQTVPAVATINRILIGLGLVQPRKRKRPKDSYKRWSRPAPMQLWQLDIVGGVWLVDEVTGEVREAKVVTGVDDCSRYCVSARVVERATGRQVCLAFAEALIKFGIPDEVLTDNGKQFTDRFGKGGEVLFDKICRHNGIAHRLTQPASPTTTGKVERFHLTLRRELLDGHEPFTSLEEAQAAVDAWVDQYNTDRPHQALDGKRPVTPGDRFAPIPEEEREVLPVWLPPYLVPAPPLTMGREKGVARGPPRGDWTRTTSPTPQAPWTAETKTKQSNSGEAETPTTEPSAKTNGG
jgi:transposase InsO family protein